MSERYCSIDTFSASLTDLLGDVFDECDEKTSRAVRSSARKGAQLLREKYTAGIGRNPWSDEYRNGFKSHVESDGRLTVGEIGNKAKPGLVHLLEKGHLTPAGHRTGTFRHMAPAFDETSEYFVEAVDRAIRSAIGG